MEHEVHVEFGDNLVPHGISNQIYHKFSTKIYKQDLFDANDVLE